MTHRDPEHLLVRARGDGSPLYATDAGAYARVEDFTRTLPVADHALGLPDDVVRRLTEWNRARPTDGFEARPALRKHVKQGLEIARLVAKHLGPGWVVRFWDERHQEEKFVCWGCERLHWTVDAHDAPPHPLDITVEGEYGLYPLHAEGFGSLAPDDPAAALHLSDDLVTAFYQWKGAIETTLMNDGDDDEWQRLFEEGRDLSERLARELGPARTVTYRGIANGGLAAMTSVTWRGDHQL
ncbi:hypothetical protein GCM10023086_35440 [Streptomyces venetus]|uniref:Uncharacterized protein n=1 Tax=Streptomyces venetus TaxID=1701086 RepID=A0ABP8FZJ2_9ACTN